MPPTPNFPAFDPDSTGAANPFAKMIKAAVCEAFGEQRDWITAELRGVIEAIGRVNIAPLALAQKATEAVVSGHGDRLNSVENRATGLRDEFMRFKSQFEARLSQLERDARARPTDPAPALGAE